MPSIHHFWKFLELGNKIKWTTFFLFGIFTLIIFIWNVKQYYFHTDDCYISFRYALNFYKGYGLVWNPGERVEGYTNFLWVIIMAFGMAFKIPPEIFSNVIGIASGVVVLALLVCFSAKYAGWDNPIIWLAPLILVTSRSFTGWCTGGLATMFFTMLLFLAVLQFLREREQEVQLPICSSMLLSLSSLIRPDALLFTLIIGVSFVIEVMLKRRKFTSLLIWIAPYILIVGIHFLWRYSYYGYWLPNTFYAKVSGFWGAQGYRYLSLFHQDYKILFFLSFIFLPTIVERNFIYTLFLALIMVYLGYLFYIGGDRFEFRFLVYLFPFFYWLLVEGIRLLTDLHFKRKWLKCTTVIIALGISAALLATTHAGSIKERKKLRYEIESLKGTKEYANRRVWTGKFLRLLIDQGLLPDDIILCTGGAGAVPYYTQWPTIDLLGMNDARIAHQKFRMFEPVGHQKKATKNYLQKRKVELFDVDNFIVHNKPGKNQKCASTNKGCLKSIKVGDYYLHFKTFLPDDEFRNRFEKLLKAKLRFRKNKY